MALATSSGSRTSTGSPARSGAAPPVTGRGGPLPVPAGRLLGRSPTCSWRTGPGCTWTSAPIPSTRRRVRHGHRAGHPRQGGERILESLLVPPRPASTRRASPARSPCSRTTPTRPATPTAATRIPGLALRRVPAAGRRADPFLRQPTDLLRGRQGACEPQGALYRIAQRAEHIWEGVSWPRPVGADHQQPRRAPRRRRALPAPARDRRRLQHVGGVGLLKRVGPTFCPGHGRGGHRPARPHPARTPSGPSGQISHDMSCRRKVRLANGREASALEIQREDFEKAAGFVDRRDAGEKAKRVVDMRGRTCWRRWRPRS